MLARPNFAIIYAFQICAKIRTAVRNRDVSTLKSIKEQATAEGNVLLAQAVNIAIGKLKSIVCFVRVWKTK